MSSTIHIGSIIRDELRRQGKTNAWFAKEINVNTRTVNKIFLKGVIDTHQLLLISQAKMGSLPKMGNTLGRCIYMNVVYLHFVLVKIH